MMSMHEKLEAIQDIFAHYVLENGQFTVSRDEAEEIYEKLCPLFQVKSVMSDTTTYPPEQQPNPWPLHPQDPARLDIAKPYNHE